MLSNPPRAPLEPTTQVQPIPALETSQTVSPEQGAFEEQNATGQTPRSTHRSLLRHAPLLVLALIILADFRQMTDPDLWGHLRFGQMMLSSGKVVSHDPFSYTAFGSSWRDHEYLTEIIMALVYNAGGVVGLKIWKLACIAATILFLVIGLAETSASCLIQFNTLAVTATILEPDLQFRPQLHTYALFALTLALLARHNYQGFAPLWLMVPVMALWSNLHGGFIIGLITLVTYTGAVALLDLLYGRGLRRGGRLGAITTAAAGATLLPPGGLNSWRALLTTISSPMTFRIFTEWQTLGASIKAQWQYSHYGIGFDLCLVALWAGLVLSLAMRPHGGDFRLLLVALVMSLGAVRSVRNVPLAAIACVIPAARHLGLLFSEEIPSPAAAMTLPQRAQWLIAGAALLMTGREVFSSRLPTDMAYPSSAVDFMKQHRLQGNVLAYFCWGEYLIWHLAPRSRVFFDSRYDMVYPLRVTRDYLAFYWDLPGGDKVLRAYPHDFVLIPPNEKAYDRIIGVHGWKLIYHDDKSALFARAGSPAAQVPGIPVTGNAPSVQYFP
jgi:hypothetical protein